MGIKLSKEEQIKVLEDVIRRIGFSGLKIGLCADITYSIHRICGRDYEYVENKMINGDLDFFIDGFSIDNAMLLSAKYGFKTPNGKFDDYWWRWTDIYDIEKWYAPRIAFIKALIIELGVVKDS